MSTAFLTPSSTVVARSPMADVAAAAGGVLDRRHGWIVPACFASAVIERAACDEAVGWADASSLTKLELSDAALRPTGAAVRDDRGWWCPVTAGRCLRLVEPGHPVDAHDRRGRGVVDVTTQLAGLRLIGPAARETIARFCALDLRPATAPSGAFRPGSIARTPGYVLCEATDRCLLLFGAAYAEYVWTVVSDAGERLGGRAVGTDAVTALAGPREEAHGHA